MAAGARGVTLRAAARTALAAAGVLPTRYLWRNPFKIVEFEAIMRRLRIAPGEVVLDLGCGSGPQDVLLARKGARVIGLDVSAEEIARARARAAAYRAAWPPVFLCTPVERAGLAGGSIDKAVSFSVLEHIANRDEAIEAVFRALKPGGEFVFSVDSLATIGDPQLIAMHRRNHAVVTYFTAADLHAALAAHGFCDVDVRPLFCGDRAARLFAAGIEAAFSYRRWQTWPAVLALRAEERRHASETRGLFLLARARKPEAA